MIANGHAGVNGVDKDASHVSSKGLKEEEEAKKEGVTLMN